MALEKAIALPVLNPAKRLLDFQAAQGLPATGVVDDATRALIAKQVALLAVPPAITPIHYSVHGTISGSGGDARGNLVVKAFAKSLRGESQIGQATTDVLGRYSIQYPPPTTPTTAGVPAPTETELSVRVFSAAGVMLAQAPLVYNALADETVDLVIATTDGQTSEYERYFRVLSGTVSGVPFENLTNDDLAYLAGQNSIPVLDLAYLVFATKQSQTSKIPVEIFYAFYRQNLPTNLTALLKLTPDTWRTAVTAAISDNIIAASFSPQLDAVLKQLQTFVGSPLAVGASSGVLAAAGLSAPQQQAFLQAYVGFSGTSQEFWTSLRANTQLQTQVDALQSTLQLSLLTTNNAPLIATLRSQKVNTPRDVARLGATGLQKLLKATPDAVSAIAPLTADETADQKVSRYVNDLMALLNATIPTAFLSVSIDQAPTINAALVKTVLAANPTWSPSDALPDSVNWGGLNAADQTTARTSLEALRKELAIFPGVPIDTFLGQNPVRGDLSKILSNVPTLELRDDHLDQALTGSKAFAGVQNQALALTHLKRFQRVMKVVSSADQVMTLMGEGLDSAMAIAAMAKPAFVATFGSALGPDVETVYERAKYVSAATSSAMTNAYQNAYDVMPMAIGKTQGPKQLPNFTTLFGSYSLCDCQDCLSVTSPAAYLVDLLQFINPKSGTKPLTTLLQRRPDLAYIPLTCENTNTALPYIDLVNEILEFYVAHNFSLNSTAAHDSGDASPDDLNVTPEYTLDAAYDILKAEVYPPTLPFDRPVAIERLYLQCLGSGRADMMQRFQKNGVPADADIATESLNITSAERAVMLGTDPHPLREFYGYASDSITYHDPENLSAPAVTEPWQTNVARVPEFLRRTGLVYSELLDLLTCGFVNVDKSITLTELDSNPHCDLNYTVINNLTNALPKIHRFVRLARKLGWALTDLDQMLPALQETDLTLTLLQKLAAVRTIQSQFNLTLDTLASFWGAIPSRLSTSLYFKLFQNKAISNPPDGAFTLSQPPAALEIIGDGQSPMTLTAHVPALLAALRLGADDLAALRSAVSLDADSAPLTMANVAQLHRFTALARALKLNIPDFLSLRVLSGLEPFVVGDPRPTVTFITMAQKVKSSTFSVQQLNYIYRHLFDPTQGIAPTDDSIAALALTLQTGLKGIIDQTTVALDPTGEILRQELAMVLDATLIDTAMAVIDGTSTLANPGDFIDQQFKTFLDPTAAKVVLLDLSNPDLDARKQAHRAYVLNLLLGYLRTSLSQGFITQTLSTDLKVDASVMQLLLTSILKSQTFPGGYAMADFLSLTGTGLSANYYSDATLTTLKTQRVDETIDFAWATSPDPQTIPAAPYSAKWSGQLLALYAENYTFFIRTNGGVRLTLNGQVQIDHWAEPAALTEYSVTLPMLAGTFQHVELQFFKTSGQSILEFRWSSPSTPKAIVPETQLYAADTYSFDAPMTSYRRLHKAAVLIDGFKMTAPEVRYLSAHASDFDGFDLNTLPLDPAGFSVTLFTQWSRFTDVFALRDAMSSTDLTLMDVFAASSVSDALSVLQDVSGWDATELAYLAGPQGFNAQASDFKNERLLLRLEDCLDLIGRLGVSSAKIAAWIAAAPDTAQAKEVVDTTKSKYDPDQWATIAKPLNDTLREAQRDALVSYLLCSQPMASKNISDANQLFAYFLIDVEMSACMQTSRIKQAISSVQLFIQSCLMNLEPSVSPQLIDQTQWDTWMKSFVIWQANREIFLYPENWIEPELRDDKSPFFKDLENQLLSNAVTKDTAEDAFLTYLTKLDTVAKLEICGLCEGSDSDGIIMHVFARTPHAPHAYYYRQQQSSGTWTAWEQINIDIEGDHLIPVVYNGRLMIFWPHFEQKTDDNQQLPAPYVQSMEHYQWESDDTAYQKTLADWQAVKATHDLWSNVDQMIQQLNATLDDGKKIPPPPEPSEPGAEPQEPNEPAYSTPPALMHWEIKLVYSEYKEGAWTPKQTSTEFVVSPNRLVTMKEFGTSVGLTEASQWKNFLNGVGTKQTIVSVYLPEEETHFFKTRFVDGDLIVDVYRRYWHFYEVLNLGNEPIHSYDHVGSFRLVCGIKMSASSQLQSQGGYYSLSMPDTNTNSYMTFLNDGPNYLRFTSGGTTEKILQTVPVQVDNYSIVYQSHKASFALKPPFQRFFYQDKKRAYYAHYHADIPPRYFIDPGLATLGFTDVFDDVSITNIRNYAVASNQPPRVLATGGTSSKTTERSLSTMDSRVSAQATSSPSAQAMAMNSVNTIAASSSRNAASNANTAERGAEYGIVQNSIGKYTNISAAVSSYKPYLQFETFFHPHLCPFLSALSSDGVAGLLALSTQQLDNDKSDPKKNLFKDLYQPGAIVHPSYPRENVDFAGGAYSGYNWELFFHIPMRIATSLSQNQQFQDAQTWFHYIFNPTNSSSLPQPQRYWNTLPFFTNDPNADLIQNLLNALDSTDASQQATKTEVIRQIKAWRENPFNPHLIARMRITAYQKNVLMKYIDNLIAWADQLFSQDTIEAINEATLLYILAYSSLGLKPVPIPSHETIVPQTYNDLKPKLDDFSNALVSFENDLPYIDAPSQSSGNTSGLTSVPQALYFCIPKNDQLLAYWDTVADRLYKIRNCMNIEGVVRQLPLFEPPIDPAILVKATAAGLDLSSVLSDINSPLPNYRFSFMLQKALELCGDLKSLGAELQAALEKQDGEALSVLRSTHETSVLKAVRDVKQQQIDEANAALVGLQRSYTVTQTKRDYFQNIVRISPYEQTHMDQLNTAQDFNEVAQSIGIGASAAHLVPDFHGGTSGSFGSPVVVASYGGSNVGSGIQAAANAFTMIAGMHTHSAGMASVKGGYDRRWDDWKQQEAVANKELDQINQQITTQQIRVSITQKELDNQDLQIQNAEAIDEFLRDKYTNGDLYSWSVTQISKTFFQAYKLAYDLAQRAEKAYRFELGLTDSDFIQFGYWDNLKKGLLSGEQLALDLKRMDASYLDLNKREYEITKQVSLAALDPLALLMLKETGTCQVTMLESLFDIDYPGHYMRRLKSVSLTIPCVVGPYTGVNATLTLLNNTVRIDPDAQRPYVKDPQTDDPRFVQNFAALQSIAASHAQNDSGLFELNFRDERYLPFEGAGAVSTWQLNLATDFQAFDHDTITDVIFHLKYTARDGGALLKKAAGAAVKTWIEDETTDPELRLFSARHEFPTDWHRFLNPVDQATEQTLSLDFSQTRFSFLFRSKEIDFTKMDVFLKLKPGFAYKDNNGKNLLFNLAKTGGSSFTGLELKVGGSPISGLPYVNKTMAETPGAWSMTVQESDLQNLHPSNAALVQTVTINSVNHIRLNPAAIEDLIVICHFTVEEP